ncbi:MAG TPA: exo-alpha-sialidase [bacterium]|nr:exo-alpha-sialidase [bacterium]
MKSIKFLSRGLGLILTFFWLAGSHGHAQSDPFFEAELIFPVEHWHNHSSCIVEAPNGDLLVCWYHGSGERQADDVVILGARMQSGASQWGDPFLMDNTPGYPDANPAMFIDPEERLWLLWPTILANEWHTALMKYRISLDYLGQGPPKWDVGKVLHVTPGDKFQTTVQQALEDLDQRGTPEVSEQRAAEYREEMLRKSSDKFYRRLGWMTRAHPIVLENTRLIVPLYSDGFSFSLMAISDDWGETWSTSTPLVGLGSIQPSLAQRSDGTIVAYMRDNGPPPKRLHVSESNDRGETWSPVRDSQFPNPGSGAEVMVLENGHWVLIYNDLERGRYSLAVALSEDEGRTWQWKRHVERDQPSSDEGDLGQYHYPSIIQAADGTIHASYSYFLPSNRAEKDAQGRLLRKSIKHAHFNESWIRAGEEF